METRSYGDSQLLNGPKRIRNHDWEEDNDIESQERFDPLGERFSQRLRDKLRTTTLFPFFSLSSS